GGDYRGRPRGGVPGDGALAPTDPVPRPEGYRSVAREGERRETRWQSTEYSRVKTRSRLTVTPHAPLIPRRGITSPAITRATCSIARATPPRKRPGRPQRWSSARSSNHGPFPHPPGCHNRPGAAWPLCPDFSPQRHSGQRLRGRRVGADQRLREVLISAYMLADLHWSMVHR